MPTRAAAAPQFIKVLAHDIRWQLLSELVLSDRRVGELVERIDRPQNLISYHLRQLRESGLVNEHRSSADGRDFYYSLDLHRLSKGYRDIGNTLHPALAGLSGQKSSETKRPYRILFLCTHNSARSQMAEGILHAYGGDRVQVDSGGSHPSAVHPLAIRVLAEMDIDISGQRSKSMHEFTACQFDAVITVCDQAREVCPVFPNDPRRIHWSFPDPAAIDGPPQKQVQAFKRTALGLASRINYLLQMIQ
jgi:protein-tyrosine-phosphatase/DNA-binding transcriptional ArsR family regulator